MTTDKPGPDGATPSGTSRRRTLRSLVHGRPGRAQIVVAALLAALGFAAVVQVRLTRTDDSFSGAQRSDLVALLDSLSGAVDRAQQQIDDLQQTRSDLLTSSERRRAALVEARSQLGVLQILTGTVAAVGPGVTVTIDDPGNALTAPSLLNGLDELRDAGAEAIEINNTLRVVASTSLTDVDGAVMSGSTVLYPPYVIDVIGSSHTLAEAVMFPGGLADEVEQVGGHVAVHEAGEVEISSLHTLTAAEYSQPTNR